MKIQLLALLVLSTAPLAYNAAPDTAASAPVNVTVNSESKELASGYAQAFSSLRKVPFHVQLQRDGGKITVLSDIKSATASGAVLILETGKGLFYIINPKDVVWFSDTPVVVEKPVVKASPGVPAKEQP